MTSRRIPVARSITFSILLQTHSPFLGVPLRPEVHRCESGIQRTHHSAVIVHFYDVQAQSSEFLQRGDLALPQDLSEHETYVL